MSKELSFFKESKENKKKLYIDKPTQFNYENLEFFRNLIISYDQIPIEGLTIEYILSEELFNSIDEHLFHKLKEMYDEEYNDLVYIKGAEVIHFNIAGINFRFINEESIE